MYTVITISFDTLMVSFSRDQSVSYWDVFHWSAIFFNRLSIRRSTLFLLYFLLLRKLQQFVIISFHTISGNVIT